MGSVKTNIVDLEVVYNKLNTSIDKNITLLKEGATAVDAYNKKISVIPSQFQKSLEDIKTKTDAVTKSTKRLEVEERKLQQERIKDLKLQKQREQNIDKYNAQLDKEAQKLVAAQNLYNKTQQQLNAIQASYNNLAVKKERYNNLTDFEEKRLLSLGKVTERYNATLKAVDATVGKHSRNVGNYASGFNPLSNSINQMTREMPAFTYSVQTGFMALSNNIPIFTDAIGNAAKQNKILIAQGEPTTSVLKQVAGALFSFQTLMGVGITLLTVYGKEIGILIGQLFGASDALDELNSRQKEFNASKFQGKKDAQSEILELQKYLAVVKDVKVSDEERNIALKKLRSQFPFYFKELTDAQILTGNYSEAEKELTIALEKRKEVEKKTDLNVTNKQKLLDLEKEVNANNTIIKQAEERKKVLLDLQKTGSRDVKSQEALNRSIVTEVSKQIDANKQITKLKSEITGYQEKIIANDSAIFKLKKETIGLEFQDEKLRDSKSRRQARLDLELADFLASEFELRKANLQKTISLNEEIFKSESNTLEARTNAFRKFTDNKIALEQLEFNENKRLQELTYNNAKDSLNEEYKDYIANENTTRSQKIEAKKELNRALNALDKKNKLDVELIELNHQNNVFDITRKSFEKLAELREKYFSLERNKEINDRELAELQKYKQHLESIDISTTTNTINKIDKIKEKAQIKANEDRLKLEIDAIQKRLNALQIESAISGKITEEEYNLKKQLHDKKIALDTSELQSLEKKKQEQLAYNALLESTYRGFISDFANDSGFGKMIDIFAGGLDKFKGDAIATTLAVSEAFQEMYNTMAEYSMENFEAEYARLETQRDFAIEMAGGSATAREEIDRQYEERKKAIQRREAEAQKRLAIFNIAVNTAQAIVGALALLPSPSAIPTSIAVGLIGAAQIAMVASQEIPQFWKGTENAPEGLAWTQEKGAEVITDKRGNVKTFGSDKGAQLTHLSKGDKVYKSHEDYINKVLSKNGISDLGSYINIPQQKEVNNSFDMSEMKNQFSKLASVIKNKEGVKISIDKKGVAVSKGGTEFLNNRLNLKSREV